MNDELLDLDIIIQTNRLTITPVKPGDGNITFEAVEESRAQLESWFPWAKNTLTSQDSEKAARMFYTELLLERSINLTIKRKHELIGLCSIHDIDWKISFAAIGYWCRISKQKQGYMREAVAALVNYGFQNLNLKRIEIICYSSNQSSCKLAEDSDFKLEFETKDRLYNIHGTELVYSKHCVKFRDD